MPIIVFQHSDNERPGRLGTTLRDHAFRLDVRRPDRGEPLPPDLDGVEGVISLGGPQHVADRKPWMDREIAYLRAAHDAQLPLIGICLGHQLIAAALGAAVTSMNKPEAGFADVDILPAGHTDPILAGIAWRSPQFHLHNDEVRDTPPGATLLASTARCTVQAFRAGLRTYAFQYHPEFDRPMIKTALIDHRDMIARAGLNGPLIDAQTDTHYEMYARLGDRLADNIATCLIPRLATPTR
jgi:GMP synthase-like glutamine amidotransferase